MTKVGVVVPTRNRSALLKETLVCLLEQVGADFEVLVLDNASDDDTYDVFTRTVGQDPRFRYHRQEVMLPVTENFLDGLERMKSEYFLWRADDDLSSSNFISRLSESLDLEPFADLAVTPVQRWHTSLPERRNTLSLSPFPCTTRIDRVIHLLHHCRPTWIYGMWRRSALQRNVELIGGRYPYLWASDHMMMMPTILAGQVVIVEDALFIQRILGSSSYALSAEERLKARAAYSAICLDLLEEVVEPDERRKELLEALDSHYDDRVGHLVKLKRRAFKERLLAALGIARH